MCGGLVFFGVRDHSWIEPGSLLVRPGFSALCHRSGPCQCLPGPLTVSLIATSANQPQVEWVTVAEMLYFSHWDLAWFLFGATSGNAMLRNDFWQESRNTVSTVCKAGVQPAELSLWSFCVKILAFGLLQNCKEIKLGQESWCFFWCPVPHAGVCWGLS